MINIDPTPVAEIMATGTAIVDGLGVAGTVVGVVLITIVLVALWRSVRRGAGGR